MNPYQLFIDSLQVRFLHLQEYALDYRWRIHNKKLEHTVLWIIDKGSLVLEFDGVRHACQEGQACIIPAHSVLSSKAASSEIRLTSLNFDATISFLSSHDWTKVLHLPVVYNVSYAELQPILQEMSGLTPPFFSLIRQAGLLRILYALLNSCKSEPLKPNYDGMDKRIHTIIDYILCHQDRMPDVAELARLVELSESHLRKLFIQHTGLAPLHFVHRLKIEQAQKRLIGTNLTIAQIAFELGITNVNYFCRLFKAKSGFTPQQYRHQFRI